MTTYEETLGREATKLYDRLFSNWVIRQDRDGELRMAIHDSFLSVTAPLLELMKKKDEALVRLRASHSICDDDYYSCPKSDDKRFEEHFRNSACECGADQRNEIVDSALSLQPSAYQEKSR